MSQLLRKLMSVYMNEADAGDGTGDGGGSSNEDQAAADKAAAEKAEADKVSADKAKTISDAEAKLLKEVMDKKNALKKTSEELAQLRETMKDLEELGGVEALKTLAKQKKELEAKELEEKGEWARLKQQMNDEHGKAISEKLALLEEANSEKRKLLDQISNLTVGAAFSASEFIRDGLIIPLKKVRALYGSHFEFKDGVVVAYDKPAGESERTMIIDAKGDPMNFEDAMKKIIDADPDRDSLLKSKSKSGAGSGTSKKTTDIDKISDLHGKDRIALALSKSKAK
jgi:hypothetical protein